VVASSRYMASFRTTGGDSAFIIITAVIIGGASLKGGKGTVTGTFLGLVLLAMIYDSFVFLRLDIMWNRVAIGLILIIVVLIDTMTYKERTIKLKT
ncbi:MAG: ABC transporter permease, partial [Actinobacteria bacterium]|nr:ABC transporter permease [Actinomycetota bacterium]